jgi:tryptophanyl-tRNA synthetase
MLRRGRPGIHFYTATALNNVGWIYHFIKILYQVTDTDRLLNMKKRLLTGDTPTGKLHIGHYVGTLENRVKLQNEYETFIVLADLHAFTTKKDDPNFITDSTLHVAIDNLAVGLDPKQAHIFVESGIPELYELAAIMSMYVTHATALRNPTIKDEIKMKGLGDVFSLGFINYPIYQAADILCVKGELVPVGIDQEAHLEQSREIARELNKIANKDIFPEPQALIGRIGKLVGTDGNPKMSKSLGNTIFLSSTKEELEKQIKGMYTDPNRIKATDPGQVEGNPVFIYLDTFGLEADKESISDMKERYKTGNIGDVEVKSYLIEVMDRFLSPIRERHEYYSKNPNEVRSILKAGTERARSETISVLRDLKSAMNLNPFID